MTSAELVAVLRAHTPGEQLTLALTFPHGVDAPPWKQQLWRVAPGVVLWVYTDAIDRTHKLHTFPTRRQLNALARFLEQHPCHL